MPTPFKCLSIAAALLLSLQGFAFGQIVQVGPGYVRAPFTRVWHGPNGEVHVRAPFTDVYSNDYDDDDDWDDDDGWRMRRRDYYGQPNGAPAYGQPRRAAQSLDPNRLAALDWNGLRGALSQAVANFDRDLSRMPTGDHWHEHFRIEELASYAKIPNDGPPSEDVRGALYEASEVFTTAQADPQLGAITRLQSFRDLQAVIAEYVSPPDNRLRLQLQASSLALQEALGRFNTGDSWKRHLALPDVVYVRGDAVTAGPVYPSDEDLVKLDAALATFDSVSQDARYSMIAKLPTFVSTHTLLGQYVALYHGAPEGQGQFETLPAPAGVK